MIKQIGIEARKELEIFFQKKVYLDLRVKTIANWRDKDQFLDQLGYQDFKK